jgi:hypothetical protein
VGEFLLSVILEIVVEAFRAAWRHDFPDPPHGSGRAEVVEVAPQTSPAHPLWDREIDGL